MCVCVCTRVNGVCFMSISFLISSCCHISLRKPPPSNTRPLPRLPYTLCHHILFNKSFIYIYFYPRVDTKSFELIPRTSSSPRASLPCVRFTSVRTFVFEILPMPLYSCVRMRTMPSMRVHVAFTGHSRLLFFIFFVRVCVFFAVTN